MSLSIDVSYVESILYQLWGSFIKYIRTKGGVEQKRTSWVQGGEGIEKSECVRKKTLLHVFCNIFICKVLSTYFLVFDDEAHYYFIKHLLSLFSSLSNALHSFSLWNY